MEEPPTAPLREWYFVGFDDRAIALQVCPPNGIAWEKTIAWERIIQVCFKTGDWMESDEIYLFTDERPESYVIPTEAEGGRALWSEILARQLFDAEMAIQAATTTHELFCSPLQGGQKPEAVRLSSPSQLPDLEGEMLHLEWDQIEADSIIRHRGSIIWQERTGWEVYDRFEEIAAILKQKYGKRLTDLVPTTRSFYALYGDSTRGALRVSTVRQALGQEFREEQRRKRSLDEVNLARIRSYLKDALDCEEEYLYQGEMSNYMRSYASDAADQLNSIFRPDGPFGAEIDCCVEALSDPDRIRNGRSKQLLLQMRENSRPILNALANSADPQLRIFALETADTPTNPTYFSPLGSFDLKQRLLNDPDEKVQIAAISASKQTIDYQAKYLQKSLQDGTENSLVELLRQLLTLLNDASANVRTAAAKALGVWAAHAGEEALDGLLEHEHDPEARKALLMAKAACRQTLE
ncbi:MAG: HEAT repeat domain-containing protein [Oscillatoriophycideae cyanobacterium NC_groundwater_1537_Pr4_S-0.65um_50_18]|nr:HEAT repeat domain-containing protein [Oscillatoriophycideae cyanobacterium NC_groundwater_1537_Pr4_S-0.65um_50_18]